MRRGEGLKGDGMRGLDLFKSGSDREKERDRKKAMG